MQPGTSPSLAARFKSLSRALNSAAPSCSEQPRQRTLDGKWFDPQPQRGDLFDDLGTDLCHECPTEGHLDDQAFFFELAQRLSQWCPTDAELGSDVRFPQLSAWAEAALENGLSKDSRHRVQRGSLLELLERHTKTFPQRSTYDNVLEHRSPPCTRRVAIKN